MSQKQLDFIVSLMNERDFSSLSDEQRRYLNRIVTGDVDPPSHAASRIIEALLDCPRKPAAGEDVPAGRYALALDGKNVVEFFMVDRPTEGKWAGFTFVKQQAAEDFFPVKGARKAEVLAAITADTHGALLRYGLEIGRCGRCNIELTDDVSRAMGIGPDCAAHVGIDRISRDEAESILAAREAAQPASSQLDSLPGESWEDIFKGAA